MTAIGAQTAVPPEKTDAAAGDARRGNIAG
jgi:hypothetical protein